VPGSLVWLPLMPLVSFVRRVNKEDRAMSAVLLPTRAGSRLGAEHERGVMDDLKLRPGTPGDAEACGRIYYEAFGAIAGHHQFPRRFPLWRWGSG
jgi:hypothetical protein